ncbi:cell envelope integrity protein TolA [Photobacterium sagamiensis]|uniref:cell envelope integrity protein TolA n=1 Tax=Photobacterium sagamiensis TaxID=2910241 RepID=UPI003D11A998
MKKNNYSVAVIISLCLHALLLAALLWGTDFSMNKPKIHGNTIKAVVVDPALVNQQAQKIRQQRNAAKKAEQDRLKRLEQQADSLEKQRKAEEQRLRELKADKLQAEKETRKAEAERKRVAVAKEKEKKKAAEEKRKADEATRVAKQQAAKADAERKAKQEATRKAKEETRKAELARQKKVEEQRKAEEAARKAEEETRKAKAAQKEAERKAAEAKELQRQQEDALNDMFSGLEAETEQRGGARGQFVTDEADRYGTIYTQMIQQNLLVDQGFLGKECVLTMRLSVNGLLLDASQAGGDKTLCRAAKAAVVKVSQFPMPDDPLVIEKLRSIRLTVSPQ